MAEDILDRPRALRALIELRKIEPKTMTAGDLQRATGYTVKPAVELRNDLEAWGLIEVDEVVNGRVTSLQIRLTPGGREVVDHALRAEAAALRAKRARSG